MLDRVAQRADPALVEEKEGKRSGRGRFVGRFQINREHGDVVLLRDALSFNRVGLQILQGDGIAVIDLCFGKLAPGVQVRALQVASAQFQQDFGIAFPRAFHVGGAAGILKDRV